MEKNKKTSTQTIVTSCGIVRKVNGKWLFSPEEADDNVTWLPFTDHWTIDTLILRHNGKYGIYSLPNMRDFGNDGSIEWESLDKDAFPYDEIQIMGMEAGYYGIAAYRKGDKWGILYFYFIPIEDRVDKNDLVPCQYTSLEEATLHLIKWKKTFETESNRLCL